jgi:hypothetical protein
VHDPQRHLVHGVRSGERLRGLAQRGLPSRPTSRFPERPLHGRLSLHTPQRRRCKIAHEPVLAALAVPEAPGSAPRTSPRAPPARARR